jgi:hypothetical protein
MYNLRIVKLNVMRYLFLFLLLIGVVSCKTFRENIKNRKVEKRLKGEWILYSGAFLPGIDLLNTKGLPNFENILRDYNILVFNKDSTISLTHFRKPNAGIKDSTNLITIQKSNWAIENQKLHLRAIYIDYMWSDGKIHPYKVGIDCLYRIEYEQGNNNKFVENLKFYLIPEFSHNWNPK